MEHVKKLKDNKRFREIIRFGITGGICFLVDYGILLSLKSGLGINYLISSAISFSVSVIVNYYICKLWTFEGANNNNDKKVVIAFVGSSVIGLVLNQIFMWGFVSIASIDYRIAKIITTFLVMIWNYTMKRKALVK